MFKKVFLSYLAVLSLFSLSVPYVWVTRANFAEFNIKRNHNNVEDFATLEGTVKKVRAQKTSNKEKNLCYTELVLKFFVFFIGILDTYLILSFLMAFHHIKDLDRQSGGLKIKITSIQKDDRKTKLIKYQRFITNLNKEFLNNKSSLETVMLFIEQRREILYLDENKIPSDEVNRRLKELKKEYNKKMFSQEIRLAKERSISILKTMYLLSLLFENSYKSFFECLQDATSYFIKAKSAGDVSIKKYDIEYLKNFVNSLEETISKDIDTINSYKEIEKNILIIEEKKKNIRKFPFVFFSEKNNSITTIS